MNHREAGYTEQVVALSGGKGPDVIIEMAAHITLQRDFEACVFYMRLVHVMSSLHADCGTFRHDRDNRLAWSH